MKYVEWLATMLLFLFLSHLSTAADTITPDRPIKDNGDVIVSQGKIFALGFLALAAPRIDILASGIISRGYLILFKRNQTLHVWSTNISITGTRNSYFAQLLDSGNLVLLQNDTRTVLWQSLDYPTNIAIPFMKIGLSFRTGLNRFLTSWKSPDDPGKGNYSYTRVGFLKCICTRVHLLGGEPGHEPGKDGARTSNGREQRS
ncbi:hypothetical protein DITRI_Ditri09bG0130800 [Diplodiscus trichospermus]